MADLPKRYWLLPVLAVLAWWPIDPYWQSDDYLALHYAADLSRALQDFAGPQYGSTDVWLFFRPLITLSFWLDQQVAGVAPFWAHFSNVLAHGVSTLLAALLLRRFVGDRAAFVAALLWSLLPSHVGALSWAVGRVDSHTTVWCLATLLAVARSCEARRDGRPHSARAACGWLVLALCSKELAFVVPPLAGLLAMASAPQSAGRLPTLAKVRFAVATTWPLWLTFAGYLAWRWYALGRFGGYLAGNVEPRAALVGLGEHVANLLVAQRWCWPETSNWQLLWALPALAGGLAALTRPRLTAGFAIAFVVAAAPMVTFFADSGNVHNLRYFYLPSIALVAILVVRHPAFAAAALALSLLATVSVRAGQREADRQSADLHRSLLELASRDPEPPLFVAGLPHQHRDVARTVQLHFGVDRLLAPPFWTSGSTVPTFALRPLADGQGVFAPFGPGAVPTLPGGSTWVFADPTTGFARPAEGPQLPELEVRGDADGVLDFGYERLLRLATDPQFAFGLTTGPGRPQGHRITLFTANGYLSCLCFDHGPADAASGTIDARKLLAGDPAAKIEPARYGLLGAAYLGEALDVPTTIDLVPSFPALIEAGSLQNGAFVPSARARRMVEFRFDRRYPAWKRLVQGR